MISRKFTIRVPEDFLDKLEEGLLEHGLVKIIGLGVFEIRSVRGRRGRNPSTGQIMQMPAYRKIKFTPTAPLKKKFA